MTTELISHPEIANLCLLVSKAFSFPRNFESWHPQSCRELVVELPPKLEESGLALAEQWEGAIRDIEPVLLAYARLFIGPFEIQAPPYASHYLETDHRLMGEVSMWVADTYADSDLGPADSPAEAPDHVALEWEFLYYLGFQANRLNTPEWSERSGNFIDTHMIRWIPLLAEAILAADTHPFYRALAGFTPSFLRFLRTGDRSEG